MKLSSFWTSLVFAYALTPAFANTPAAAPAAKVDLAKGEALYTQTCFACHGVEGNSSVANTPKLAQQHPEYLVRQLHDFKSGTRNSPIMKPVAQAMSEEDMRNVAYWLASKKGKLGFGKDKAQVALGEKIYRGGIADRMIPACAGCHSPNGAGIPAQYPRLAGQNAEYTSLQLTAFRDGGRKNNNVMHGVAAKMNDHEIKAVSDYIAGLR